MSRPPDEPPVDGIPASIAAIMAAIRHEVAAPAAAVPGATAVPAGIATSAGASAGGPVATGPVAAERAGGVDDAAPCAADAGGVAGADAGPSAPVLPPGLDAEVRTLVAPLLRAWLDAHLPEIVEAAVHAEIRRLTGMA